MTIKFSDYVEKIKKILNEKGDALGINEPSTLIEGFMNQPVYQEFTGGLIVGGPTVLMIGVVGDKSGRIYYFALKALLPDIGV